MDQVAALTPDQLVAFTRDAVVASFAIGVASDGAGVGLKLRFRSRLTASLFLGAGDMLALAENLVAMGERLGWTLVEPRDAPLFTAADRDPKQDLVVAGLRRVECFNDAVIVVVEAKAGDHRAVRVPSGLALWIAHEVLNARAGGELRDPRPRPPGDAPAADAG